jgi:nucleoside phosphorylase
MNPIAANRDFNSTSLSIDTIVVPQGAEYQAVCRGLQQAKNEIQVISIPIGTKNVAGILANFSKQLNNSQRVLIMGLCGSLDRLYRVGDVVLVQSCQDLDRHRVELDLELTAQIQTKLSVDLVAGLTSDRLIFRAEEKLQLSQEYPVSVVDMEGYGYVTWLQQRGIAVAMLRVVSDDLGGNIPDLSSAIDPDGNLRMIPMAIAFGQQPVAAIRLIKGSLTGLKTLRQITTKLVAG